MHSVNFTIKLFIPVSEIFICITSAEKKPPMYKFINVTVNVVKVNWRMEDLNAPVNGQLVVN